MGSDGLRYLTLSLSLISLYTEIITDFAQEKWTVTEYCVPKLIQILLALFDQNNWPCKKIKKPYYLRLSHKNSQSGQAPSDVVSSKMWPGCFLGLRLN